MDNYWSERYGAYSSGLDSFLPNQTAIKKSLQSNLINDDVKNAFSIQDTNDDEMMSNKGNNTSSLNDLYELMNTPNRYKSDMVTKTSALKSITNELNEKKLGDAPYLNLADNNGIIAYNGITFVCDKTNNAICLGDVSDKTKVLSIPLSGGGSLMVNRDNIDGLAKSIGMFSPEDVKRIMDAISLDAKVAKTKNKIEDEKTKVEDINMDTKEKGKSEAI